MEDSPRCACLTRRRGRRRANAPRARCSCGYSRQPTAALPRPLRLTHGPRASTRRALALSRTCTRVALCPTLLHGGDKVRLVDGQIGMRVAYVFIADAAVVPNDGSFSLLGADRLVLPVARFPPRSTEPCSCHEVRGSSQIDLYCVLPPDATFTRSITAGNGNQEDVYPSAQARASFSSASRWYSADGSVDIRYQRPLTGASGILQCRLDWASG
jgi:hypothetical protein